MSPPRPLVAIATSAALIAITAFGLAATSRGRPAPPARLVVLPFQNAGDSDEAYFADGITDGLRANLAAVPGIEVIAAGSASRYRHPTETPEEIGRTLHVRYVLRGTVSRANGRVVVHPELFDIASAGETWALPYSAPLSDVFAIESSIVGRVASAL